ncbi:sensor domain-containing diguanylate cyclase [bacterium]|nr:sensor domain-containing diguanylate cyclase [bacterium]
MNTEPARIKVSKTDFDWTRFGFLLEEELGDLLTPQETLQSFGTLLKKQLPLEYLEVFLLPGQLPKEAEKVNWVQNDTGYGGKLLSIILRDKFLRRLPRRKQAVVIDIEDSDQLIENRELLRIMELKAGILVPLTHKNNTYGVLSLFSQRETTFSPQLKRWLVYCGAILIRALLRSWEHQAACRMATTDHLTGLVNHRHFMEQLQTEFTRARRYQNWLSLILIDIDFFKQYNDINGHLAGDLVLKKVAQTIKKSVREMDLLARWGGEEFALLLPESDIQSGMIVAEKIRREVEALIVRNQKEQPNGNLTISLGVAANNTEVKNYREMFKRADTALYQAKHDGRNRCSPAK